MNVLEVEKDAAREKGDPHPCILISSQAEVNADGET